MATPPPEETFFGPVDLPPFPSRRGLEKRDDDLMRREQEQRRQEQEQDEIALELTLARKSREAVDRNNISNEDTTIGVSIEGREDEDLGEQRFNLMEDVEMAAAQTRPVSVSASSRREHELEQRFQDVELESEGTLPSASAFTLERGTSVGVQIDPTRIVDLSSQTRVLQIPRADNIADRAPRYVKQGLWKPGDSQTLAVSGDTFCGLWRFNDEKDGERDSLGSEPSFKSLVSNTIVTAMAWDATGSYLAVSTYSDMMSSITLFDESGKAVETSPDIQMVITAIHWAPWSPSSKRKRFVTTMSDTEDSSHIAVWEDAKSPRLPHNNGDDYDDEAANSAALSLQLTLSRIVRVPGLVYDLHWAGVSTIYALTAIGVHEFVVRDGGEGGIDEKHVYQQRSGETRTSGLSPSLAWSFLATTTTSDRSGNVGNETPMAVTASSTPDASIWMPTHAYFVDHAHTSPITALQLLPQSRMCSESSLSSVIFATSSFDGAIKFWSPSSRNKTFSCLQTFSLSNKAPVLNIAFPTASASSEFSSLPLSSSTKKTANASNTNRDSSSNATLFAAVSERKLLVWNLRGGNVSNAAWTIDSGQERQMYDSEGVFDRVLRWSSGEPGQAKLALGFGSKVITKSCLVSLTDSLPILLSLIFSVRILC